MNRLINTKFDNAIIRIKKQGYLQFIKYVFERLGFVNYNRTLIFYLTNLNYIPNDFEGPFTLQVATIDDIHKVQDYYDGWFTKEEALQRLKNGHRLLVIILNNKMVYAKWIEYKKVKISWFDLHFDIPGNFIYSSGLYTAPELRRTGIAYKMEKEIWHYLKTEGINYEFTVIDVNNMPSIKLTEKLGFKKEYQRINYRRYWHIRRYKVQKFNSNERKTFITLFNAPKDIWKTFL